MGTNDRQSCTTLADKDFIRSKFVAGLLMVAPICLTMRQLTLIPAACYLVLNARTVIFCAVQTCSDTIHACILPWLPVEVIHNKTTLVDGSLRWRVSPRM